MLAPLCSGRFAPPRAQFEPMSEEYVGVDVGGTKIAPPVLRDGELADHAIQPTDADDAEAMIEEICDSVEQVRTEATAAVGVGVPSVIEWETGRARTRSTSRSPTCRCARRSASGSGYRSSSTTTRRSPALAEAHDGDELVVENLVMFTVGTGVGGGLVLHGRPYRGATGAAAELGHTLIGVDLDGGDVPAATSFPQRGSLESLRRRPGARCARAGRGRRAPRLLSGRGSPAATRSPAPTRSRARRRATRSPRALLELLGERLGIGIANAINTFDPEVVAIGGGVSSAGELLLEPARRTALRVRAARGRGADRDQARPSTARRRECSARHCWRSRNSSERKMELMGDD